MTDAPDAGDPPAHAFRPSGRGVASVTISERPAIVGRAVSDGATGQDLLGVEADVNRLAGVLCARATTIPLAVAILADWGTGKSSFMKILHDRVDRVTSWQQEVQAAPGADPATYVSRVRQVRFNAWHYSDNSVLVGIVEKIFKELAEQKVIKPPPSLIEIDKLRETQDDAARALEDAENNRRDPGGHVFRDIWAIAFSGQRGVKPVLWLLLFVVAVLVAWRGHQLVGFLPDEVATTVRLLIAAVVGLPAAIKSCCDWLAVWQEYRVGFEQRRTERRASNIAALQKKVQAAEQEYREANATASLAAFLRQQQDGSQYDAYRGAVGLVYRNLEVLAERISKDREQEERIGPEPEAGASIDRIVLYVDDLDRCAPERVVEVLHAVNLLQVLPLFVAVVSVDAKWLQRSLEYHDRAMFGVGLQALGARVGDPLEYLDKIFQIPFALAPMSADAAAALVRALLAEPVVEPSSKTQPSSRAEGDGPSFAGADMSLTQEEKDNLTRVSRIIRTPRGVKRLVNLYRLVRAGRLTAEARESGQPGNDDCRAVAYLLAAIVGMPAVATCVLTALAEPHDTLAGVLQAAGLQHRAEHDGERRPERCGWCSDLDSLSAATVELLKEGLIPADTTAYGRWLAEVSRYSFHSAELLRRLNSFTST